MNKQTKKTSSNISISSFESKENGISLSSLRKKFFSALSWNLFEAIGYQALFIAHQSLLFFYLSKELYGAASTLLGIAFAGIVIITGALDTTLMVWIADFTQDKKSYRHCMLQYLLPQALFYLATPLVIKILYEISSHGFSKNFIANPTIKLLSDYWLLIGIFIGVEGLRKLLRHLGQLMFMNKQISILELVHLIMYCSSIWTMYGMGYEITVNHLIIPFVVVSLIITFALIRILYQKYQELPESLNLQNLPSKKEVKKTRIYLCINQFVRTIFSSNILIPIASGSLGFIQTSYLAYSNYVIYTITFCMYRICIPAAAAFFGNIKKLTKTTPQQAFATTFSPAIWSTLAVGSAVILVIGYGYWNGLFPYTTLICLLILGTSHIVETLYTLYEKFFIIQKKFFILTVSNISHLATAYLLLLLSFNIFYTLIVCSTARILTILALSSLFFNSKKHTK